MTAFRVANKTQADGDQDVDVEQILKGYDPRPGKWTAQLEVSATPTSGTLAILVKSRKAETFVQVGTIDMTNTSDYLKTFDAYPEEVRLSPSSFDADKSYSVTLQVGHA